MSLGNNFQFRVSTEGKTYEFDLHLTSKGSGQYSIIPKNESDLTAIKKLLQCAFDEKPSSIEDLSRRLRHIPAVTHVSVHPISKTHTYSLQKLGISLVSSKKTEAATRISSAKEPTSIIAPGKGTKIHSLLESLAKKRGFQGTVMVVDQGKPILKCGYGKADQVDKKPMLATTRLPIGSVSKPISAIAALKLVESGHFKKLGKPIYDPAEIKLLDFLPEELKPDESVRSSWTDITLLDLINHTSGLPSFPEKGEAINLVKSGKPNTYLSPEAFLNLVKKEPTTSHGEYNYSNFGYLFLGKMIEFVTDSSYEEHMNYFLQEELGMSGSGYVETDESGHKHALPMQWNGEKSICENTNKEILDPPREAYSAGGLYSTVEDLSILSGALLEGKVISPKGVKKFMTATDYGAPVEKDPRKNPDFRQKFICNGGWNLTSGEMKDTEEISIQEIWKTGAVGGYGSLIVLYPNQNSSVIILSNQPSDVEAITNDITHALFVSESSEETSLSSWEGVYRIPEWGVTFSIAKSGSSYVFRETLPFRKDTVIKAGDTTSSITFNWGPEAQPHFIKEIENQLFLCGPNGEPIPGAKIDKVI